MVQLDPQVSVDLAARWLPRMPGNVRGRATADRLTLAALEVAEEKGVAETTVDEICRVACCSRRTFFHHFPSREAALLGSAVPTVEAAAVARYLAEPIPILTGAIELVHIPEEMSPSTPLGARRFALLRTSGQLQAAARERMMPAAAAVLAAVTAKVAQLPGIDSDKIEPIAEAVTVMAAGLIQSAYSEGSDGPSRALRLMAPIWQELIH